MAFSIRGNLHIDWNRESYPRYQDFVILPFFILFFPSARLVLDRLVFERLAKRFIFGKYHVKVKTSLRRKKIDKFKESAWKAIYSVSTELLALYVTYNEPWFNNTKYFWMGPEDQVWPDQKMKLKLKLFYMYSGGFYIYAIFALIFWDTRRSDFKASMAHHVITVALIVLSYMFRFGRVGSIVLALHEGSDFFLETAKMSKYSGANGVASIFFPLFVLSWFVLRLFYFPFYILWSTSYEVLVILGKSNNKIALENVHYYVFNSLLFFLLFLHCFWGRLLLRMLGNQIQAKGQISDDVRSDSEGEEEHEN